MIKQNAEKIDTKQGGDDGDVINELHKEN
jgi:hypothetical protein